MSDIKSILFVCTGNSCRSVMAEGYLKKRLKELGRSDITVHSAGIRALTGMRPTEETIEVLKEESAEMASFRSRSLTDEMIENSDLILVMEDTHKEEVIRRVPSAAEKTHLLKEFSLPKTAEHHEGFDIPDPIGRPLKDYKYCFSMIKKEIERIIKLI